MVKIADNNIIVCTAGDTFSYPLFINLGSRLAPVQYILEEGDKVYFSIMKPKQPFNKGIVRKVFDINNLTEDGRVNITLSNEDTEFLPVGTYYYEIKLAKANTDANPSMFTIVPKRKFYVK